MMANNFDFYFSYIPYVILIIIIIIIYVYLRKRRLQQKQSNYTDSLKKGSFDLSEDEEKQGVIGFSIAGIFYRDEETKDQIYSEFNFIEIGEEFYLETEPNNKYDENAIKVLSQYGTHYGYVPRYLTYLFLNEYKQLRPYHCILSGLQRGMRTDVFIKYYPGYKN